MIIIQAPAKIFLRPFSAQRTAIPSYLHAYVGLCLPELTCEWLRGFQPAVHGQNLSDDLVFRITEFPLPFLSRR